MRPESAEQRLLLPRAVPLVDRIRTPEERALYEKIVFEKTRAEAELLQKFPDPRVAEWSEVQEFIRGHLVYVAGKAKEFSWQWRKFNVGAALLAFRDPTEDDPNPWVILFSANTKDEDHGVARCCAEQYLMNDLKKERVQKVVSLAMVGRAQTDDESGRTQTAITPCHTCRPSIDTLLNEEDPMIEPDTEIFTVNSEDVGLTQLFRVKDLPGMHVPNGARR